MGKKLNSNPKAVEARARKEEKKDVERSRIQQKKEDALWTDEDKQLHKKLQRKENRESKQREQQERKNELKKLYEEEQSQLKGKSANQGIKVTQAQIQSHIENQKNNGATKEKSTLIEVPLEENINRLKIEGECARTVDEAIAILDGGDGGGSGVSIDRHPERRVKAAYEEYEAIHLPLLKEQNKNMRLSQLKQLLRKQWLKAPENPLNQRCATYNVKRNAVNNDDSC